jgi:hypothetical protein
MVRISLRAAHLSTTETFVQIHHNCIYTSVIVCEDEASIAVRFEEAVGIIASESDTRIHT